MERRTLSITADTGVRLLQRLCHQSTQFRRLPFGGQPPLCFVPDDLLQRRCPPPLLEQFELIGSNQCWMGNPAGSGEAEQFETQRGDVHGAAHRLQFGIKSPGESRILGSNPGGASIGVAALRLDTSDGKQRGSPDVDQIATDRHCGQRCLGKAEPTGADEHDVVSERSLCELPVHPCEPPSEGKRHMVTEGQWSSAGSALATVDRDEIWSATGRCHAIGQVDPEQLLTDR